MSFLFFIEYKNFKNVKNIDGIDCRLDKVEKQSYN